MFEWVIVPWWFSWASMERPEWFFRNIKNLPCSERRKSWRDFLFWIDLVKEQIYVQCILTKCTHPHNWRRKKWRRKTLHITSNQANQRPQDKLPTFHRLNWSSLSFPIIQAETHHLTLSTCSGAVMWITKRYFNYEQGLTLHVDPGLPLVFLLNCPDSSFQHTQSFSNMNSAQH